MSMKILVVDDEPDLQGLILQKFRRAIRDGAVNFVFAADGVEALAVLAESPDVGVVLSDINMPRMDGLTLLQELQASHADLSTVIVSAYGDMANIRTAMNRGAFDFVTKPIDLADLDTTIGKTIRHVAALREARARQAAAERAHAALSRFFSPNLAERLAADAGTFDLSGQRREVAAIFTDIAGFTSLVETLDPAVLGALLNDYIGAVTEIVFAYDGTVSKIIGDAIYILFGAPTDQPDHARRAIACALAIDETAQAFRARWAQQGVALGVTRIGVYAGMALVGNFGGGRYFDYTAYGDTINIAARLEGANKALGTRVCVSAAAAERVADFQGRPVGDLTLRGRSAPMRAYEPLSDPDHAAPQTQAYRSAFAKLAAADPAAMPAFAALVGANPNDALVNFHLKRLLNGAVGATIALE